MKLPSATSKCRVCTRCVVNVIHLSSSHSYILYNAGYPGIPPGAPDRPQAAIKGVRPISCSPVTRSLSSHPCLVAPRNDRLENASIGTVRTLEQMFEVRLGTQGVKAKYVRIELRKIETLPGGGTQSTFFDYVGQSPINLWQSSEEFSTLQSVSGWFLVLYRLYGWFFGLVSVGARPVTKLELLRLSVMDNAWEGLPIS